jgi:hypothetical protein
MTQIRHVDLLCLLFYFLSLSCAQPGFVPTLPDTGGSASPVSTQHESSPTTLLWSLYNVQIDPTTRAVRVSLDRNSMATMNVVNFLNSKPASLKITINKVVPDVGFVDIDLDVAITHPLNGSTQYNVYDVRGVFIGNAGAYVFADMLTMAQYPHYPPITQFSESGYQGSHEVLDDPAGDGGGPDGYTRWFYPLGFPSPGLFGYTKGLYASDIFSQSDYYYTANLNPYKFFADGLGPHDDLMDWLESNPSSTRVFSAGSTNTRNYYIRFPATFVEFAYAVTANWESKTVHPSNMREAVACEKIYATVHPDYHVYDFKIYDPLSDLNPGGWMDDYMLSLVEVGDYWTGGTLIEGEDLVPIQSGDGWCEYHCEIPTSIDLQLDGFDFWVIVAYPGYDYTNPQGVPNNMGSETLAAWFCYDLDHSDQNWE